MVFKSILPHLIAFLVFLVLCSAYFWPQVEGKVVQQGDVIQYMGMSQEVREFQKETGEQSLWTNAMFGGMPTYQINTVSAGNNLKLVDRIARLDIAPPIGRFLIAMVGFYILMVLMGASTWLSIVGAIAFGFTTNNMLLYEAGHETKLKAISYFPLLVAGVLLAFRKKYIWGGLLFAMGLGLNLWANHIQMTYYLALTMLFWGLAQLIVDIRKGEVLSFAKAAGVLIIGAGLALGSAASNLWITYEYSKDTMRGEPILKSAPADAATGEQAQKAKSGNGLDWDYAMQWSNGGIDVFAGYIAGVAGGGSSQMVDNSSEVYQTLRQKGYRVPANFAAPLYWGALPFTSGPIYFGAVVVFLFLLGAIVVKDPVKWWLVAGVVLTVILSMGKNMEGFNRFFFDHVPLYNKFRTPNSILSVTAFLMPLLGILGVSHILNGKVDKKEALRALYIAAGIAGAVALFFWFMGPSFYSFANEKDASYVETFPAEALIADRKALMSSDAMKVFLLVALSAAALWAYLTQRIKQQVIVVGVLGALTLVDLWSVGRRYLNEDSFVGKNNYEANFAPRPVDEQILQDPDLSYRVMDLSEGTFQSSKTSYFHQSIGGYHAAKLQRYQDMIDRHFSKGNQKTLDMLNTRYFIVGGSDGSDPAVQRNPNALGNAWFVGGVLSVNSPEEEIEALNGFNPADTAVVNKEFDTYLQGLQLQKGGSIKLTAYAPNKLTYESETTAEQLAVFSEIWYGPNKGWQAYVDGKPVEHIRANYILRAMRVPAGKHTIEFKFDPKSFKTGKAVSMAASLAILLIFLGWAAVQGRQYLQRLKDEKPEPVAKQSATTSGQQATAPKGKSGKRK